MRIEAVKILLWCVIGVNVFSLIRLQLLTRKMKKMTKEMEQDVKKVRERALRIYREQDGESYQ